MGSLTEKYQQLRNGTEEKQRIEQEMVRLCKDNIEVLKDSSR